MSPSTLRRLSLFAVATALLVGGSATPAFALSEPPVEITAPVAQYLHDNADTTYAIHTDTGGVGAQTFVPNHSGPVTAVSMQMGANPGTFQIYAADQFTATTGTSLTPIPDTVFSAGTPLGSANFAAGEGQSDVSLHTSAFDQPVNLVKGTTYWLVVKDMSASVRFGGAVTLVKADGSSTSWTLSLRLHFAPSLERNPIGVELTGTEGDNGWFNGPVTAKYTCWDTVTVCPDNAVFDTDGDHQPAGTVDNDGTDFAWFHHVKVDTTDPTITGKATRTNTGHTVTWTCKDTGSGIVTCPDPTTVKATETSATATVKDKAGNSATTTVDNLFTRHYKPTLVIKGVVANKTYKHGTKITPTCSTSSTRPTAAPTLTCKGTTTHYVNKDGSVKWRYEATAIDSHPQGASMTRSASWTIAARAEPTVNGLPSTTKNGHPVITAGKSYDLSFVFRDANGTLLKAKPTWLHSVATNKAGTTGTPWKKLNDFTKKKGAWTKSFVPGHHYKGQYRKFGVIAPDGTRHHFTVYVK